MTKIKYYREKKNLSQEDLSEKSGVSRTIISNLENDKSTVTTNKTMQKIADALEESVTAIFLRIAFNGLNEMA